MSNRGMEGTVRTLRREIPLTLVEFSKRAGISYGYLSDIERGRTLPSPKTAKKIAQALGQPWPAFWQALQNEYRERAA